MRSALESQTTWYAAASTDKPKGWGAYKLLIELLKKKPKPAGS